jgi:uncharacterized delta-60 repeat protein
MLLRATIKATLRASLAVLTCATALFAAPSALATIDGTVDMSFGAGGQSTVAIGSWAGAASVAVQSDGKIVTAGEAEINGQDVIVATRMLSNGQLDPTFAGVGIAIVAVNGAAGVDSGDAIAIQSNGKILIAGGARDGQYGPIEFAAVRLNANGTRDTTFGVNGVASVPIGPYSIANGIALQSNGKIVLGGTAYTTHIVFAAARLNANGTIDTSFGTNGATTIPAQTAGAWGVVVQPDGKVALAGQADYNNPAISGAQQFMVVRLTASGTPDRTFGSNGTDLIPVGGTSLGFGVAIQSNGQLLVAGPAYTTNNVNAIVRLNTNGSIDASYGTHGVGTINTYYGTNGLILDRSGRPVLPLVGPGAERFNTNGTPDTSFGTAGTALVPGGNGGANGAAVQANGAIVLGGATTVNGLIEISVIRMSATGTTTSSGASIATGSASATSGPSMIGAVSTAKKAHPGAVTGTSCLPSSRLPMPSTAYARHQMGRRHARRTRTLTSRFASDLASCARQ